MHMEGDPGKTQGAGGHLHIEERDLRRGQPCQHLGLGLLAPGPERSPCCWGCPAEVLLLQPELPRVVSPSVYQGFCGSPPLSALLGMTRASRCF